jgi:hypothetical protein
VNAMIIRNNRWFHSTLSTFLRLVPLPVAIEHARVQNDTSTFLRVYAYGWLSRLLTWFWVAFVTLAFAVGSFFMGAFVALGATFFIHWNGPLTPADFTRAAAFGFFTAVVVFVFWTVPFLRKELQ